MAENRTRPATAWHKPGFVIRGSAQDEPAELQAAFQQVGITLKTSAFPWWGLKLAALFSPLLKEVIKMRYLWQQPVIMNGEKMIQRLGNSLHQTALPLVVEQTLLKL